MHWIAIIISAIIFGVAHGNAAQGIHAFISGLLLGWMFYRTGSIIPGLVLHWTNNTISYIITALRPDIADKTLVEICGGDEKRVLMYVGFSMLIILPTLFQLAIRMKKTK